MRYCIAILVLFSIPFVCGCAWKNENLPNAANEGHSGECSSGDCKYLFAGGSVALRSLIGPTPDTIGLGGIEHSSDGTVLRLWSYARNQAMVLITGQTGRIIETPPGAFLDRENKVVFSCKDLSQGELIFPDGLHMNVPAFVADEDGQYLCVGGRYYEYSTKVRKDASITIRHTSAPERVVATSSMRGILWKSFCFHDTLYLFVRQFPNERSPGRMVYEVYKREGQSLALQGRHTIESPMMLSAWVVVEDICPDQQHSILYVKRDLPLRSHRYLLNLRTKTIHGLGPASTQDYVGFLSPCLFKSPTTRRD